jgi:predicted DNA-binding WGR domain protein
MGGECRKRALTVSVPEGSIIPGNRSGGIDSKVSLDAFDRSGDARVMAQPTYHLHVQRIDASRNMARYYRLAIEATLFGNIALVRNWGRIGTRGQERVEFFDTEMQALSLFLKILREKRRKGYQPAPQT